MFNRAKKIKNPLLLLFILLLLIPINQTFSATPPSGFTDSQVASGLERPTSMAFLPDGRLLVGQQKGRLRVVKNGSLLSTPYLTVSVDTQGERGLLGVAVDPNFSQNKYVYVYYTSNSGGIKNRVSRFTQSSSSPDTAGSEFILLDNIPSAHMYHNGGAIHFGKDGYLYIAVGDNRNSANGQSTNTLAGKILRINKDGSIPSSNPYYSTKTGSLRAIYAHGFRNPFTFAVNNVDGSIFVNDVGESTYEEVNRLEIKGNYGWSTCEGSCSVNGMKNPIYFYGRSTGQTIAGGAFYTSTQFSSSYRNQYYFGDYISGWIKRMNTSSPYTVSNFATGANGIVDIDQGSDGALYYLRHGSTSSSTGEVRKIFYGTTAPTIPPVSTPVPTAQPTTIKSPTPTTKPTNTPVPTISVNKPPQISLLTPTANSTYKAGDTISFSATATDPEDGTVPASNFTWYVEILHNDDHTHPFKEINGVKSGTFTTANENSEVVANLKYHIILRVNDSKGLTSEIIRDVLPITSSFTLTSNPHGLELALDGMLFSSPKTVDGVVGFKRYIEAPLTQTIDNKIYQFSTWSDSGQRGHYITTPQTQTTYTANYVLTNTIPTATPTPNNMPTVTPAPTNIPKPQTYINIRTLLDGIGSAGDALNPSGINSNKSPRRNFRQILVTIQNESGAVITTATGTINYQTDSGEFAANLGIGPEFPTGNYDIYLKTSGFLRRKLADNFQIKTGETNNLSPVQLTNGDTNNDNKLTLTDYNNVKNCYKNLTNCANILVSDLNDDGNVDSKDYNLFLREYTKPNGD